MGRCSSFVSFWGLLCERLESTTRRSSPCPAAPVVRHPLGCSPCSARIFLQLVSNFGCLHNPTGACVKFFIWLDNFLIFKNFFLLPIRLTNMVSPAPFSENIFKLVGFPFISEKTVP